MKHTIILLLLCPLMLSCRHAAPENTAYEYDMAEVYYVKVPSWDRMGFNIKLKSFHETQPRDLLFNRFTISDRDSLRYIADRLSKGRLSPSPAYKYWCPRIIVLLHNSDRVDTLITNTYTGEPLQFNSSVMQDATLGLYLTECVGKHDWFWEYALNMFFYNGNMQMISAIDQAFNELDSLSQIANLCAITDFYIEQDWLWQIEKHYHDVWMKIYN